MTAAGSDASQASGPRALRHPVIRIVLAALFLVLPSVGLQAAAGALSVGSWAVWLATVVVAPLAYLAFVRLIEGRRSVHELGTGTMAGQLAAGIAIGAALFGLTMLVLWLLGAAEVGPGEGWGALLAITMASLSASVWEELLFRAALFRIVSGWMGDAAAIVFSAVLFALLHAANPGATAVSTAALALEAGVLLGAAYMVTRQVWLAIGLHLAWNVTEGGVFGAAISGHERPGLLATRFRGDDLLTGGEFGPEASIVAVVVCLAAAAILIAVARRRTGAVGPAPGDRPQRATAG